MFVSTFRRKVAAHLIAERSNAAAVSSSSAGPRAALSFSLGTSPGEAFSDADCDVITHRGVFNKINFACWLSLVSIVRPLAQLNLASVGLGIKRGWQCVVRSLRPGATPDKSAHRLRRHARCRSSDAFTFIAARYIPAFSFQ